jgi:glycosyltransferase involved in cell wall biosynthesis
MFTVDRQVPAYTTQKFSAKTREYCVVIPVINEGPRIARLLARMAALNIPELADIVIVDGGSKDGSLAEDLLRSQGVTALLVKTGRGKLSAQLRCAYDFALAQEYAGVVTIDGNDKDDPKDIPVFIEALRDGVDFVQASRFLPGGEAGNTPKSRDFAIRYLHAPALAFASGFPWTDTTQGFRAYSRNLLVDPELDIFREVFDGYELLAYLSYRAPRLGFRCVELPSRRVYPEGEPTPTKIGGLRGNLEVLLVLARACFGVYDPPSRLGR